MTPVNLLEDLKKEIEKWTKDLLLEVRRRDITSKEIILKTADVYLGKMPAKNKPTDYVPFYLCSFLTGTDFQNETEKTEGTANVRIIAVAYSDEPSVGYIDALNMIDRVRINLLRQRIVGKKFLLNMKKPIEYTVYDDDTGMYSIGEIVLQFDMPSIEMGVNLYA